MRFLQLRSDINIDRLIIIHLPRFGIINCTRHMQSVHAMNINIAHFAGCSRYFAGVGTTRILCRLKPGLSPELADTD